MNIEETIFDDKAIKHFYSDVLHTLLPKARHKSVGFFGSADVVRVSEVKIDLADTNEINFGSPYSYDKNYTFIHYTSVQSLINILRNKSIRLYNLHGMDDKLEFTVPLKNRGKGLSEYDIDEIKKKIFCLSMCETYSEFKGQSLMSWRNYGFDGNGIGIVLSFNENYTKDWVYFMLSKVFYTDSALRKFQNLDRLYNEFKIKYNLTVNNFDSIMYKYFAFHKHKIYKPEKEVRLLYCQGLSYIALRKFQNLDRLYNEFKIKYNLTVNNFDSIMYKYFAFHKHKIYKPEKEVRLLYCQGLSYIDKPPIHYDINRKNKKTTYIELDLEWDWDAKTRDFILKQGVTPSRIRPVISVDKIIFGYRIANKAKYEIANVIQELTFDYEKKPDIIDSKLNDQF